MANTANPMADPDYLRRASQWPWFKPFYNWKPFTLDALGLVTLLGHEEVNEGLGRLVPSRYVEYLPMLGAFVVAGDRFKERKASFHLYNITDGIHTTDLSCWLTRWLLAQDFEKTCSIVQFEISDKPRSFWKWRLVAFLISFIFTGLLLAMTILSDDQYGKVNAVAMIISVIVRAYILEANRSAIDDVVMQAGENQKEVEYKKCMVILSDSKTVTLFVPKNLIPVLIFNPEPKYDMIYHGIRWIGWAAFAVHVLSVGNATLIVQEYVVGLIVIPTILMHWKFGCDDSKWMKKWRKFWGPEIVAPYECWIGSRARATCFEWPLNVEFVNPEKTSASRGGGGGGGGSGVIIDADRKLRSETFAREAMEESSRAPTWSRLPSDMPLITSKRSKKRQDLYAWLNLSADEESSMGKWDLFPHERKGNASWWADYNAKKALIAADPPRIEDMKQYKHITRITKNQRTTTQDKITTVTSQRVDSEKHDILSHEGPKLGLPRIARYSVSGPDGLVRAQSANVY